MIETMPSQSCSQLDCEEPQSAKSLCTKHYDARRWERKPPCSIEGCTTKVYARGLCHSCYDRARREQGIASGQQCSEGDCSAAATSRGLCHRHYGARRYKGEFSSVQCSVRHCESVATRGRLCHRHYQRKSRYGFTVDEMSAIEDALAAGQLCPICDKRPGTDVDHCHVNGYVRGLLCHNCNVMIGYAENDPDVLDAGAAYLRRTFQVD